MKNLFQEFVVVTLYKSSILTDDRYSNLVSTDLVCTNCMTKEQRGKRENIESCSYQTKIITDYESGETICSNCGMVISDRIRPDSLEWHNSEQNGRIYGSVANPTRQHTGPPSSLANYDKGLYTVIGKTDFDVNGRLGLSDAIIEKTAYVYRKAEKRGIIRGRIISSRLHLFASHAER